MANRRRINELVLDLFLDNDHARILSADGNGGVVGSRDGFEGVFDLVEASLGGEDRQVAATKGHWRFSMAF